MPTDKFLNDSLENITSVADCKHSYRLQCQKFQLLVIPLTTKKYNIFDMELL